MLEQRKRAAIYIWSPFFNSRALIKTKIKSIESDYVDNLIYTLRPVEFVYKRDTETLHYGLIAQEVRKSLDDMGEERKLYLEHFDGEYRSVEYYELIAPLIKAVQDLHSEVENLKEQIAELKGKEQRLNGNTGKTR